MNCLQGRRLEDVLIGAEWGDSVRELKDGQGAKVTGEGPAVGRSGG